jgi:phosphate starvation-inducible protein PhoH
LFVRGSTYNNCVLIVDEIQNLTYHELDSIITRAGDDTRLVFSGDFRQSDLTREQDRAGLLEFIKVLNIMPSVSSIEFSIEDVVRSGLVKEYLLAKHKLFT